MINLCMANTKTWVPQRPRQRVDLGSAAAVAMRAAASRRHSMRSTAQKSAHAILVSLMGGGLGTVRVVEGCCRRRGGEAGQGCTATDLATPNP